MERCMHREILLKKEAMEVLSCSVKSKGLVR